MTYSWNIHKRAKGLLTNIPSAHLNLTSQATPVLENWAPVEQMQKNSHVRQGHFRLGNIQILKTLKLTINARLVAF